MSSSALASARRRRAGGEASSVPQLASRTNKIEPPETPVTTQPITPLLVLQQHELKIKQLEGLITKEEDYEELFEQIDEKIDKLFTVNFDVFNKELNAIKSHIESSTLLNDGTASIDSTSVNAMKSLIEDKIAIQASRLDDFKSSQTQLFNLFKEDTNKVAGLLTSNIESKLLLINKTSEQLENKIAELTNTSTLSKFETELNTLKMIVIANQSNIMEINNTINNLKATLTLHKEYVDEINNRVEELSSSQTTRNSTQALFSSLMSNNLFETMNMNRHTMNPNNMAYCCAAGECESNNFCVESMEDLNNDELIMDENQIAELLEIKNFETINIDESIDVLECDVEEIVEKKVSTIEPVIEPISEPVSEHISEPVSEHVSEPVSEHVSEPVSEHVIQPVSEHVIQPVSEPSNV
jgi:hypothetical protein